MKRLVIVVVLTIGFDLAGAQGAWAKTFQAQCSNTAKTSYLENYLDGTNPVKSGDVVKLSGLCVDESFKITNTNAFTLAGTGNAKDGTPSSGFSGAVNTTSSVLNSTAAVRLTINNLLFKNADTQGGPAIAFTDDDEIAVTITHDTFENNAALTEGGAIEITDNAPGNGVSSPTVISDNRFQHNSAADGGAIFWADGSPLELLHNKFVANSQDSTTNAHPVGGAVDIENYAGPPWLGSPITIAHNTFGGFKDGDSNTAHGSGGALYISVQGGEGPGEPAQTVTLTRNGFYGNVLTGGVNFNSYGGDLALAPQPQELGFKVVQEGNAFELSGIDGTINSGFDAGGGGEWATGVSVKSVGDGFLENEVQATTSNIVASPAGGGLGVLSTNQTVGNAGTTTLLRASFTGADDLFLENKVTTGDEEGVPGWGGGIYTGGSVQGCISEAACPSSLSLVNSTITKNHASQGAAIWGGPVDSLTLENSIVHGNTGGGGAAEIFGYSKLKYEYDDACTTPGGTTPLAGTGDICAKPDLTIVGEETAKSPTIDKGSNALVPPGLNVDLLGRPRITEGRPTSCGAIVDMGAFEFKAVKPARKCGRAPVNFTGPTITGAALVGHLLTCRHGGWSNGPTGYRYQWRRDGRLIKGASKSTYTVKRADQGHTLVCVVRAANEHGTGKPATTPGAQVPPG